MKKSLCEISNPKQWKTISTDMLTETGYPVYGANGIIGYYSTYNHDCETLLITCRGATCGSLNICQPFSYVNGNAMALDSLSADIDIRYLYYYLLNRGLDDVITGSAQPQIVRQSLEKVIVEYPELNIQKSIVETLDKISKIISLRKQQLAKLDELVKSRFIEMFGECKEHKRLEEYANLITKGASPKWQGVDYCEEGTLFVTSENVREGYLDLSKRKYLDNKINEIQPRSMLKRNDILINIVGASIGRATVYDCDEVANINQAVALVRVDYSQINQTYLMTFLNSPQAIEMYGKMKKGGARDNLSLQNIADLQIPVASIDLQNQFAAFVEQTDKSKFEIQKSLNQLETLKKALMQKYFG